jgi:uncharacterized protein (DUF4415 family)
MNMANEDIKKYSLTELKAMREAGQSQTKDDAPALAVDEAFWETAQVTMPAKKKSVHLRLDEDVLAYFQGQGKGHISRMQAVLKAYAEAHQKQDGKHV